MILYSFNHKKGLLLVVFFFNILEPLYHLRRWNNTRCFHLVNFSDANGSIEFWCVLILIISRVKDGADGHFRAGLVKRVTRSQSPLDIKEYAGFKIVLYIWNIQLYMLKGYKGKVEQVYELRFSLRIVSQSRIKKCHWQDLTRKPGS